MKEGSGSRDGEEGKVVEEIREVKFTRTVPMYLNVEVGNEWEEMTSRLFPWQLSSWWCHSLWEEYRQRSGFIGIYGQFRFTHRIRHIYIIYMEEYSLDSWRYKCMDGVGWINLDSIGKKKLILKIIFGWDNSETKCRGRAESLRQILGRVQTLCSHGRNRKYQRRHRKSMGRGKTL